MTAARLTPPPHSSALNVAFPRPHVMLLTLNRPEALNAMSRALTADLKAVLDWFENEPELWVLVVTGAGRLFCAGADLKDWNRDQQNEKTDDQDRLLRDSDGGFGSLSRRRSVKPIVAAVNGGAYGGGLEMVLNCDLVVANRAAKFAFPEVKRGVVAIQGGIPRLAQTSGHQLASELLFLGKTIGAEEAHARFGFVSEVVDRADQVLPAALALSEQITQNSPDAVQSTKEALMLMRDGKTKEGSIGGYKGMFFEHVKSPLSTRVYKGDNIKEGLKAFVEKRQPIWKNPAKL